VYAREKAGNQRERGPGISPLADRVIRARSRLEEDAEGGTGKGAAEATVGRDCNNRKRHTGR